MKYTMFLTMVVFATIFMVSCDEYQVGHGEKFGVFSWDKVRDDDGNGKDEQGEQECVLVVVEQRCFEPSVFVYLCGKCVKVISDCDRDIIRNLLLSETEDWRIANSCTPIEFRDLSDEDTHENDKGKGHHSHGKGKGKGHHSHGKGKGKGHHKKCKWVWCAPTPCPDFFEVIGNYVVDWRNVILLERYECSTQR